jgi:hypothetical protein
VWSITYSPDLRGIDLDLAGLDTVIESFEIR